jgi:hypothetical protein
MADNKVTDIEMSAILAAFAESREIKANSIHQSKIFMALIIFCNIYVSTSLVIYYLFGSTIHASLNADFIAMNISAYFNVGFKALCLISLVYTLNSTIDNVVLFTGLLDFGDHSYFSIFVISRPIMFVVLAWMALSFRDSLEGY